MKKIYEMLLSLGLTLMVITIFALSFAFQNMALAFIGGLIIGLVVTRWVQLEFNVRGKK